MMEKQGAEDDVGVAGEVPAQGVPFKELNRRIVLPGSFSSILDSMGTAITAGNFEADSGSGAFAPQANRHIPCTRGDIENAQGAFGVFTGQRKDRRPQDACGAAPPVNALEPAQRLAVPLGIQIGLVDDLRLKPALAYGLENRHDAESTCETTTKGIVNETTIETIPRRLADSPSPTSWGFVY